AAERTGGTAAGRADRVPRPRHRRLDPHLPGRLSAPDGCRDPARLAQHARGRAPLRRRSGDAGRPPRRPGSARDTGRALRPRHARGGVSRHRPRRRRPDGGAVTVARAPVTRFSGRRVAVMVRRHLYLFRGSWARTAEIVYWPGMQVLLWGFITRFFLE